MKRKFILKKDKKEDVSKDYDSISKFIKNRKKNLKDKAIDDQSTFKVNEMFCLELLL